MWKDVVGYEGLYSVSDDGKVISCARKNSTKERILKHGIQKQGYRYATLFKNGTQKKYQIHRLIALAFIPNLKTKKL